MFLHILFLELLTSISSLPVSPTACPKGMTALSDWCYAIDKAPQPHSQIMEAHHYCQAVYGGDIPSVNSKTETEDLMFLRSNVLRMDSDNFWIGIECGRKDDEIAARLVGKTEGVWEWMNGEEWTGYSQFDRDESPISCDVLRDNMGYQFNAYGNWITMEGITLDNHFLFRCCNAVEYSNPEYFNHGKFAFYIDEDDNEHQHSVLNDDSTDFPVWASVLIALGVLLVVAIFCIVAFFIRKRFQNLQAKIVEIERKESRYNGNKLMDSLSSAISALRYQDLPRKGDGWEVERRFIDISYTEKLGDGAFGCVFLGQLKSLNIPSVTGKVIRDLKGYAQSSVAVKMLHENTDSIAEEDFLSEISLMKTIGYHERLVNIIACITLSQPILLITEYCSQGNLLYFMRRRKRDIIERDSDVSECISAKKQIMFAVQVAYGLEYLTSKGFIHRDIAARNIMVDEQETCKIGDFGLCVEIGKEDENSQTQGGKFPLKWMPPEAIESLLFSEASDVWSFSVLLFEIVAMGETPYADWPNSEHLTKLKNGERMEKPDNCSEQLYEIMSNCWVDQPTDRPTFTALRERLGEQLEDFYQHDYYLKLDGQVNLSH